MLGAYGTLCSVFVPPSFQNKIYILANMFINILVSDTLSGLVYFVITWVAGTTTK